jgi:hypothetical protein
MSKAHEDPNHWSLPSGTCHLRITIQHGDFAEAGAMRRTRFCNLPLRALPEMSRDFAALLQPSQILPPKN